MSVEGIALRPGIPKELVQQLEAIFPFPDICVQTFFRIKDKFGKLVDFRYNRSQRLVSERSQRFNYILKARKLGISSRRIARSLWICATKRNQHRVLLSQTDDVTNVIMAERIKPMIENCKYPLGAKPKTSDGYILFPFTDSRYYVGTAGSMTFGRSKDITGYDLTEFAHWEKPDVLAGVEEACVEGADGDIETTANGHNFAKILWDLAKLGKNRYRAIFLPWYASEEYELPVQDLGILGEDEQKLVEAFELRVPQLAWRRAKLGRLGNTDQMPTHAQAMEDSSLFPQEYPATDDEAFLTSGRLVFDWISLLRHKNLCAEPKLVGDLIDHGDRIQFHPNPHGKLRIWKVPEVGHVYGIGSDVAEGLEGGAYSTGEVIDLGDSEQVAEWHGHIDPTLFADVLAVLGKWYNWATLVPEAWPGQGSITTARLLSEAVRYPKVWKSIESDRHGFETTNKSKPLMIAELNTALRDMRVAIRSKHLLAECQAYIYKENGEMAPSIGAFSDLLMGFGIGWYATRDLASRIDYYKPPVPNLGTRIASTGGTSVPNRSGPIPGRRRE